MEIADDGDAVLRILQSVDLLVEFDGEREAVGLDGAGGVADGFLFAHGSFVVSDGGSTFPIRNSAGGPYKKGASLVRILSGGGRRP